MSQSVLEHSLLPVLAVMFVVFMAIWAVVRGVLRLIRSMITLGIGFAVGTWAFIQAPKWLEGVVDFPSGKQIAGISIIAGAIGHFGSKFILGKLAPVSTSGQGPKMFWLKAALLSLLPSACYLWIAGTLLRLIGSISSLAYMDERKIGARPWLAGLREPLGAGLTGRIFEATDPITKENAVRLCEVLVNYRVHEHLDHLRRQPDYQRLFSQSKFRRLVNDREVKRAIADSDYARLLTMPEVRQTAVDQQIASALATLPDMEVRRAERVD